MRFDAYPKIQGRIQPASFGSKIRNAARDTYPCACQNNYISLSPEKIGHCSKPLDKRWFVRRFQKREWWTRIDNEWKRQMTGTSSVPFDAGRTPRTLIACLSLFGFLWGRDAYRTITSFVGGKWHIAASEGTLKVGDSVSKMVKSTSCGIVGRR